MQPLETVYAREAATLDEAKWMMQPQDKHTYRDAMTGQPLNFEFAAIARRMFDEVEAVQAQGEIVYRDAINGQPLNTKLVEEARRQEMEYFEAKGVWYRRPRAEAFKGANHGQVGGC